MASSGEFDRSKCSEHALPVLCRYLFPTCKTVGGGEPETVENKMAANERHPADGGSATRRRPMAKATSSDRKPNQRYGKTSYGGAAAALDQQLQQKTEVEHLCREDCEDFESIVCSDSLEFVSKQAVAGRLD